MYHISYYVNGKLALVLIMQEGSERTVWDTRILCADGQVFFEVRDLNNLTRTAQPPLGWVVRRANTCAAPSAQETRTVFTITQRGPTGQCEYLAECWDSGTDWIGPRHEFAFAHNVDGSWLFRGTSGTFGETVINTYGGSWTIEAKIETIAPPINSTGVVYDYNQWAYVGTSCA